MLLALIHHEMFLLSDAYFWNVLYLSNLNIFEFWEVDQTAVMHKFQYFETFLWTNKQSAG